MPVHVRARAENRNVVVTLATASAVVAFTK